jgi:hypothetical protein
VGTSGVASSFAGLLRLAASVICLIVVASFVVFAVDQTSNASAHQQNELNGSESAKSPPSHKSAVHKALDDTAEALTSPFSGVVSGSSQWAIHGVRTVLALLVYGFGLGYLARVIRVRV